MSIVKMQSSGGANVTPDDDVDLAQNSYGLYVGTGGNLVVIMVDGQTLTFKNVPDGSFLPIHVKRVLEASTADDIISLH